MTALDTRYPELDQFLHSVRRRLNFRLLVGNALIAALAVGAAALVPAYFLPPPLNRWEVWGAVVLGASGLWTLAKWGRRLSLIQAAAWIDETRQTQGLYTAAVDALDRDTERFPDGLILRDAERNRPRLATLPFPWRKLSLRILASAALVTVGLVTLNLPGPERGTGFFDPTAINSAPPAAPPGEPPLPPGSKEPVLTPKEAARRLFPENQRLAALAEEAMTSGDASALDSLMAQNTPPAASPKVRSSPGQQSTPNGSPEGKTEAQGDRSTTPNSKPGTSNRGSGGQPDSGSGTPGREQGQYGPVQPQGGFGNPGTGHSDQSLGPQGPGASNDRKVVAPEKGTPGIFEYVLPETGARVPLSQALADSRRSSEAALDRSSAPMEFENAVRTYFLSLSQEVKP